MEAEEAKAELVARLEEASMMEVSLELVQGRGCGACCLLSARQGGLPGGEAGDGKAGQAWH